MQFKTIRINMSRFELLSAMLDLREYIESDQFEKVEDLRECFQITITRVEK